METGWNCQWKLIPGGEKHDETYTTLEAARQKMAKVLSDAVDLSGSVQALRKEGCGSVADFLEKFLSDLTVPESELPDTLNLPEHYSLEFDSCGGFRWYDQRGECPYLSAGYVYEGNEKEPYVISFDYEYPERIHAGRIIAVEIRICERIRYGTSAYPLMVWHALREEPQTQERIADTIFRTWDTAIERKAIGRHLQRLQELGFPVRHGPEGYYRDGEFIEPNTEQKYGPSAYPLLILRVLDDTSKSKTEITKELYGQFGVKISRNALVRQLELLNVMGFLSEKGTDCHDLGMERRKVGF